MFKQIKSMDLWLFPSLRFLCSVKTEKQNRRKDKGFYCKYSEKWKAEKSEPLIGELTWEIIWFFPESEILSRFLNYIWVVFTVNRCFSTYKWDHKTLKVALHENFYICVILFTFIIQGKGWMIIFYGVVVVIFILGIIFFYWLLVVFFTHN